MTVHSLRDRWRQALSATVPSTIAVALLAGIALVPRPTLAVLLAGVEAGRGVAAVLSLGRVDPRLYVDPGNRVANPSPTSRRTSRASRAVQERRTTIPPCRTGR
jgi:hypothetical protein